MSSGRVTAAIGLGAALATLVALGATLAATAEQDAFVAHEWGTFTTRHGADGAAIVWSPLVSVSELPRFVVQSAGPKDAIAGTVRMETPVIYFYSDSRRTISVDVGFPGGTITEWYPRARVDAHGITWPRVTIVPGAPDDLRRGKTASHYYAARDTDAAVIRVRSAGRSQREKFLFYRGVGTFALPLTARRDGAQVMVDVADAHPVGSVVVFARRGGAFGHRVEAVGVDEASIVSPALEHDSTAPFEESLRGLLLGAGLYPREAQAMLDTWRATWSEDGLRVFYLVPPEVTDAILPLDIQPPPAEIVRVLVGRAEIEGGAE
jgi:hypothetical protein